jgi:hypothetical protein
MAFAFSRNLLPLWFVESARLLIPFGFAMFRLSLAFLFSLSAAAFSAEPAVLRQAAERHAAPAIRVECYGTLKQQVAIGAETTGIVIVFDRMRWELNISNPELRQFALQHNDSHVVVLGSLRRVCGVERERWIVDVDKLTERDAKSERTGATVTVTGHLKSSDSVPGKTPEMHVVTEATTWPLNLVEDQALGHKALPLVDKQVLVTGLVDKVPNTGTRMVPLQMSIRVSKLDAAPDAPRLK